ncbi:MAG TPA: hypothetical protein VLK30_07870 [Candidatus Limnocylindrales bacterium]|nr:hypothetical protein [Candidatus Limnocylindrales bacterium]
MQKITRRRALGMLATAAGAAGAATVLGPRALFARETQQAVAIDARVVAIGIPGASGISPVGTFLPGGPIHDNPTLAAFTQPGRVLDPVRFVVGSTSNFGAPIANPDQLSGSFLSVDPRGGAILEVPPMFASAGDQAVALGGALQMYSAQSPTWRNGFYNPGAVTAAQTGVSNPLGISINNAFGRLWPANAPYGLSGPGTSTIDDPDGRPLKGAPNALTGGVYFGNLTGRQPAQVIPGALDKAAVGTAFLGHSADGSTRAVFCVIVADGSIVQEHTGKGLDGLAPAATVQPLDGQQWGNDEGDNQGEDGARVATPRLGAIVNYANAIVLFVSQPFDNSILALGLQTGGAAGSQVFMPTTARTITSSALDEPVDLAPVHIETEHPNWASNTTLEENSDFYVCNRGNGTVARMGQDGSVVSVRRIKPNGRSLGGAKLNGIATSSDASRIWLTYVGRLPGLHDNLGGVLEVPAF